jgi:SAM-dependent methyltransferase
MPYSDGSFDLVTCRVAAHHFSSLDAFLKETARVLRAPGWFLLIDGSVDDNEPEAEAWIHQLEMLRDPSHHRFLTPGEWSARCQQHGLDVQSAKLTPFKQPDLEWYFETAATPAENRLRVRRLIIEASPAVRRTFRLGDENGKTIWWWPRLTVIATKVANC